ncbi:hypothetical protein CsSME_00006822 [Camellia sinensis var. sinensis]
MVVWLEKSGGQPVKLLEGGVVFSSINRVGPGDTDGLVGGSKKKENQQSKK